MARARRSASARITAGNGAGPRLMKPVVKNVILASADQVAIDAAAAHTVIVIGRRPIRGREGGYFAGRRVIAIDLRVIDIDVEIDEVEVSTLT